MALRVLSVVLPALLVFTVAVNTATREYSQHREADRANVAPRGPPVALLLTTPSPKEYSQQREAARANVAPHGPPAALLRTTPSSKEHSQQREAARANVAPHGPPAALLRTTPSPKEYYQQRGPARANVAPRGPPAALLRTAPSPKEYSQQREAARANVAPRGPPAALLRTAPSPKDYSQQREAARANVAPRGLPAALLRTTPSPKEYSQQREAARANVAPRGPPAALLRTTPSPKEYSQQREARANVAPRGPPAALLRTTPSPKGTWTARNRGTARIIDGEPANVGQFPHQAHVFAEQENGSDTKVCGGTLIRADVVLTAAQCVLGYQKWFIRVGGILQTEEEDDEETVWAAESAWALIHPAYNGTTGYADLAMIYLVHDAPLGVYIKLVALPSSLEADNNYLLEHGVISGWGYTSEDDEVYEEVLHWTEVKVIPIETCKEFYPAVDMRDKLCAANHHVGGYDGDLGTGLHLRTLYGFKQIGILVGTFGPNKTRPAVYTKVASHMYWIKIKVPISDCSLAN